MTEKAQEIWEAFKGEIIGEATEDQRQALATALLKVISELGYTNYNIDGDHGIPVVNVKDLLKLIEELEKL
jgi:hypothetical protein